MKKFFRWLLLLVGALLLLMIGGGALYQALSESRDLARFPPPGQLVEVEGKLMHLHCRGEGSPTVVVDLGLSAVSASWDEIHQELSRVSRVCLYDRAGLGYSEPVDNSARAAKVAERLAGLLRGASIEDDLVLVGWSAGGLYVREFARRFPERVRAMLLIDSSHEQQGTRQPESPNPRSDSMLRLAKYLAPLGVLRATGMVENRFSRFQGSEELKTRLVALYEQSHTGRTILEEWKAFDLDTRGAPPSSLGGLALIVLSNGRSVQEDVEGESESISAELQEYERRKQAVKSALQEELAALSTRGRRIVATESGHAIHADQPDLVIDSVRELVEQVRGEAQ